MTAEALARVRRYVAMRDAQSLGRTDDQVHGIHVGTEWEAELSLSDLRAVLAMVPHELDAQTTKYLAIQTLRSAGWTCTAPVDPGAAIPEVDVGQVWRSPKPRTQDREIVELCDAWGWPGLRYRTGATGSLTRLRLVAWRAWVQKSGARPVEVTP